MTRLQRHLRQPVGPVSVLVSCQGKKHLILLSPRGRLAVPGHDVRQELLTAQVARALMGPESGKRRLELPYCLKVWCRFVRDAGWHTPDGFYEASWGVRLPLALWQRSRLIRAEYPFVRPPRAVDPLAKPLPTRLSTWPCANTVYVQARRALRRTRYRQWVDPGDKAHWSVDVATVHGDQAQPELQLSRVTGPGVRYRLRFTVHPTWMALARLGLAVVEGCLLTRLLRRTLGGFVVEAGRLTGETIVRQRAVVDTRGRRPRLQWEE